MILFTIYILFDQLSHWTIEHPFKKEQDSWQPLILKFVQSTKALFSCILLPTVTENWELTGTEDLLWVRVLIASPTKTSGLHRYNCYNSFPLVFGVQPSCILKLLFLKNIKSEKPGINSGRDIIFFKPFQKKNFYAPLSTHNYRRVRWHSKFLVWHCAQQHSITLIS